MDCKKFMSLCLALLLVFAFSGEAFSAPVSPSGLKVRVIKPDSGAWAGIGDSIIVEVNMHTGVGTPIDNIVLGIFPIADTLYVADGQNLTGGTSAAAVTALAQASGKSFQNTGAGGNGGFVAAATSYTSLTGSVETWRFAFGVDAGDLQSASKSALVVQAFVDVVEAGTDVSFKGVLNTTTATQSDITGFTDRAGDGKRFGIDGQRPLNGALFDSVLVDTARLTNVFKTGADGATGITNPSASTKSFKKGDQLVVKMRTKSLGGTGVVSGKVFLFDAVNTAKQVADSAFYSKTFTVATLVAGVATDTFNVADGIPNNTRIKAVAFLTDAAGNLSSAAAGDATPKGYSQAIVYVGDTVSPVVTVKHPISGNADTDSSHFTGDTAVSHAYVNDSGALETKSFTLRPLTFKVSEGTVSRVGYVSGVTGDSVQFGGSAVITDVAEDSYEGNDTLKVAGNKIGGAKFNLGVRAVDSVGNASSVTLSNVTADHIATTVKNLFPSRADLPEDTINELTRHPKFQIDEVADSISIRYISNAKLLTNNTKPHVVTNKANAAQLTVVGKDVQVAFEAADSLRDGQKYSLQVLVRDLAGNISVTAPDTLTFDAQFENPSADSFLVAITNASGAASATASPDSVIAGGRMYVTVTAIDTKLTRKAGSNRVAVTYNEKVIARAVNTDGSGGITDIEFFNKSNKADGVENLAKSEALLTPIVNVGWNLGVRTFGITAQKARDLFNIVIEAADTTTADGVKSKVVKFSGVADSLTIDNAEFLEYKVTAWEADAAVTGVSGAFTVKVVPSDSSGNPSVKSRKKGVGSNTALTDNELLDTRLNVKGPTGAIDDNLLAEIFVDFSANNAGAKVPPGPQAVLAGGSSFTAIAPDAAGEGLVISVRTSNSDGDPTGSTVEQDRAKGSTAALTYSAHGSAPPVAAAGAPAAPKNLIVQDYKGADGKGDQGGFVLATFPHSSDHASVSQYRIYRKISVSTGLKDGSVVVLDDPVDTWVPWSVVDAVPAASDASAIVQAVIPSVDNVATSWAVAAERGGSSSEQTVSGKRVFTKESVQLMVQLLGLDPNRVISPEELNKLITPPKDYVKSILGDQKNLIYATLDPDISQLLNSEAKVPNSIRTQGGAILSSERTVTAEAVKAVDNIPPSAVTNVAGEGTKLTWKASADDRIVGFISYRGMVTSIAGVNRYEVLRGADEASLAAIATLSAGSETYTDSDVPEGSSQMVYRVDALDLDNRTVGETILLVTGEGGRVAFLDADGGPVFIIDLTDATPYKADFTDFIAFAGAFNKEKGTAGYLPQADTDDSGKIDFTDFIAFAGSFNKDAVTKNGQAIPATKPIVSPANPGVNENAELSINLENNRVLVGETVGLDVLVSNVKALKGYGFVINYDTDKFEFVEAVPATEDLLKSTGGETPLFLSHSQQPGQVNIANAVVNGTAVSGGGSVVRLTFKVMREFEDNARFEIGEGIVFDHKQLSNPVVTMGVLEVQSTPTEFALLQNFPNPFNPETTIKYNLAEAADVHLQIYNVVGQVVRTLVAERQSAGRYQVRWNGRDDRGISVSSGIYFYHVSASKFQDVRKLMLLK